MKTDVIIVGCGVAGLYCALNLPKEKGILMLTKSKAEESDSFLAQGGICVLRDEGDYESFREDTMRAGHYENNPESVDIMISSSPKVIEDLVRFGAEFEREGDGFAYTKEGAHSSPRILFHEDETGKEITGALLRTVRERENITLVENFTVVDLIAQDNSCLGIVGHNEEGEYSAFYADYTVLATGGIGGLFKHSTNYRHLTGDSVAMALNHNIKLKNIDYIQIHPTTLYTEEKGREFLISESVRGEGAILLNSKGERFVDELQPRDVVTNAIHEEMKKEGTAHVWLSLENIPKEEILTHFPNIYRQCLDVGYDITKESIPVVPSQHYFMGGIDVDKYSRSSMDRLYAVGETSCNGVHGKNRLASNSLLESLVFARRAALHITDNYSEGQHTQEITIDPEKYIDYPTQYRKAVLDAIEKERNTNE
ncbi:MAG: L-aspartate oxidase [Ruminococcus sp.]|nr:L-aspartate oxidase [Ruminococcus sp.]